MRMLLFVISMGLQRLPASFKTAGHTPSSGLRANTKALCLIAGAMGFTGMIFCLPGIGQAAEVYNHATDNWDPAADGATHTYASDVVETPPTNIGTIHIIDSTGCTVIINTGVTIDSGGSGNIAVRDGDGSSESGGGTNGIDLTGGDMNLTSEGHVTGMAILGIGNDQITLNGGSWNGNIYGDDVATTSPGDDDTITINDGTITLDNGIFGCAGDDTIIINGGTISGGNIYGDYSNNDAAGNDTITVNGGIINGRITPGAGDDTITINAGTVNNWVQGGWGADKFYILGGAITSGGIDSGINDDTITIDGGTITGDIIAKSGNDVINLHSGSLTGNIKAGAGDDGFFWTGGEFNSKFRGGANSDTATVSASDYDGHQVLDGGDDTGYADSMIDTLTFVGVSAAASGADICNWEEVTLSSGTALEITNGSWAVGDGSGGVTLKGAALDAGQSLNLAAALTIDANSTFTATGGGTGIYNISYSVNNSGTITAVDNAAGDTITVAGNYSGNGTLAFDTDFSTGSHDSLVVQGNVTANGVISINDQATSRAGFSDEIILISTANDADKSDENFVLALSNRYNGNSNLGRWANSPFIWKLKTSGNNWVLGDAYEEAASASPRSRGVTVAAKPAVAPEIPAEVGLYAASYEISINKTDTLHQRLGELRNHTAWASLDPADMKMGSGVFPSVEFDKNRINSWLRSSYADFKFDEDDNFEIDGRYGVALLGFDLKLGDIAGNTVYAGLFGGYLIGAYDNSGRGDQYGSLYSATTDFYGVSAGAYATWMNCYGTYFDLVVDYTRLHATLESIDRFTTDGNMTSGSIEIGQSFMIRPKWIIEPQIQGKLTHIEWNDFHDGYNKVRFETHTYVTGRAGVRAEYTGFYKHSLEVKPWCYAGVRHEFSSSPNVTNVIAFQSHPYQTTGNVKLGITVELTNIMQLYADIGYTTDFQAYDAKRADLGLRVNF